MELFAQILGMTLIVLGLLAVVGGVGALIYYNLLRPGRKKNALSEPAIHPGVASDEQSGDRPA